MKPCKSVLNLILLFSISSCSFKTPASSFNSEFSSSITDNLNINDVTSSSSTSTSSTSTSSTSTSSTSTSSTSTSSTSTSSTSTSSTSTSSTSTSSISTNQVTYSFEIRSLHENSSSFVKNTKLLIKDGVNIVHTLTTDQNGKANVNLTPGEYSVSATYLPKGYSMNEFKTSATNFNYNIVLVPSIIEESYANKNFYLGSLMYNLSTTDIYGNPVNLKQLLNTKKMVLLDFFYIDCIYCNQKMPTIRQVALNEKYKNEVEVIFVDTNPKDTIDALKNYSNKYSYNDMHIVLNSDLNIYKKLPGSSRGVPYEVVIDRYGIIANYDPTNGTSISWENIFDYYIADNYIPNYTPWFDEYIEV